MLSHPVAVLCDISPLVALELCISSVSSFLSLKIHVAIGFSCANAQFLCFHLKGGYHEEVFLLSINLYYEDHFPLSNYLLFFHLLTKKKAEIL